MANQDLDNVLDVIEPAATFGEQSLLGPAARERTVVSVEPAELLANPNPHNPIPNTKPTSSPNLNLNPNPDPDPNPDPGEHRAGRAPRGERAPPRAAGLARGVRAVRRAGHLRRGQVPQGRAGVHGRARTALGALHSHTRTIPTTPSVHSVRSAPLEPLNRVCALQVPFFSNQPRLAQQKLSTLLQVPTLTLAHSPNSEITPPNQPRNLTLILTIVLTLSSRRCSRCSPSSPARPFSSRMSPPNPCARRSPSRNAPIPTRSPPPRGPLPSSPHGAARTAAVPVGIFRARCTTTEVAAFGARRRYVLVSGCVRISRREPGASRRRPKTLCTYSGNSAYPWFGEVPLTLTLTLTLNRTWQLGAPVRRGLARSSLWGRRARAPRA